jgi:hypothetical protein
MKLIETIPGTGKGGKKENHRGVNLTMIYCENFCKCHYAPPGQQYDNNKNNSLNMRKFFSIVNNSSQQNLILLAYFYSNK